MQQDKSSLMLLALQRGLRHDGGTPSTFLDTLSSAIERKIWEDLGLTFQEMVNLPVLDGGMGSSREELLKVINLKHQYEDVDSETRERMTQLRQDVRQLLDVEVSKDKGGDYRSDKYLSNNVTLLDKGYKTNTDTTYIRARLKRDNPTLYQQVVDDVLTPTKAGQMAGFIPKRQTFVVGNVEQTARQIKKYFTPEEVKGLVELLQT